MPDSNQMFGKSSGDTPDFFSCDGPPDWEKESSIKVKKNVPQKEFKICVVADNGIYVVVACQIFFMLFFFISFTSCIKKCKIIVLLMSKPKEFPLPSF